jgi:hypothetical protein
VRIAQKQTIKTQKDYSHSMGVRQYDSPINVNTHLPLLLTLTGCVLPSFFLYYVFSYWLVTPPKVTLPLSVILFILLFGLATFYSNNNKTGNLKEIKTKDQESNSEMKRRDKASNNNHKPNKSVRSDILAATQNTNFSMREQKQAETRFNSKNQTDYTRPFFNSLFVIIYVVLLFIVATASHATDKSSAIFLPWEHFISDISKPGELGASIALCFFVPGYALVNILTEYCALKGLPKILLAYLFSMLIIGLTSFVVASLVEIPSAYLRNVILTVQSLILILSIVFQGRKKLLLKNVHGLKLVFCQYYMLQLKIKIMGFLMARQNISGLIVFVSIFSLVIFYTYYLENGVIVGDQWFHHGRALLINYGTYKDVAASGFDSALPPFFSAMLAGFFSLSGLPTVNAYASIHLLNIMPVLAFYYFFSIYVPSHRRESVMLASTLFVLSSGFGWIYVLSLAASSQDPTELSTLEYLHSGAIKTSDIRTPTSFVNVGHPTFSSPLIIIALPAGFTLLGIIKQEKNHASSSNRIKSIAIITTAISTIGILAHDEFYLFILVGSLVPLVLNLSSKHFVFISFFCAFFVAFFLDNISPGGYYTEREIHDVPVSYICLIFVSIVWILYSTKILSKIKILLKRVKISGLHRLRTLGIKSVLGVLLLSVVVYLYLITFIVWDELSVDDVRIQVGNRGQADIPWYLYPMKLGVTGLLGLAFIVSYILERFEKEVFVFGIIAIVALFAGPYYDEHRLMKYIMVGMVGFASLLVYKVILILRRSNSASFSFSIAKPLVSAMLLGLVITTSGLSIFLLAGYKALAYQNPDFKEDFFRIDFPTSREVSLLNFIRANLPKLEDNDSVAVLASDQTELDRLASLLEGFTSIPRLKISTNTLTFNATTLESFYKLVDHNDIKYILIPKEDFVRQEYFSEPANFALDNFEKIYQNDNYIVLEVPKLSAPSYDGTNVGFVHKKFQNTLSSKITNKTSLPYTERFFSKIKDNSEGIKIENDSLALYGNKKGITLWSDPIEDRRINYVETKVRLLDDYENRNDFGIKLKDSRDNEYDVSVRDNSLELKERLDVKPRDKNLLLATNQEVIREKGSWHEVEILILGNKLQIYFDGVLKIKVPTEGKRENFDSLSRIGIRANKNVVEFRPLNVGWLSEISYKEYELSNKNETYYNHYFPISALALSKDIKYDTFLEGDFSVLSKKNVILTHDPSMEQTEERNAYLHFVRSGGTLVLMNVGGNYVKYNNNSDITEGIFEELLGVRNGNEVNFDGVTQIVEENKTGRQYDKIGTIKSGHQQGTQPVLESISGSATNFEFNKSPDTSLKSYYVNNNQTVAPFIIEKKFGEGELIFMNVAGYIDSTYKSPEEFQLVLTDVISPSLSFVVNQALKDNSTKNKNNSADTKYDGIKEDNYPGIVKKMSDIIIVGELKGLGEVKINSSSLLLLPKQLMGKENYTLNAKQISITANEKSFISTYDNQFQELKNKSIIKNATVQSIKLYGQYEATVETSGRVSLPSTLSYYDYIGIPAPTPFDITLDVSGGGYMELKLLPEQNGNNNLTNIVVNGGVINMTEVKAKEETSNVESTPILFKHPYVTIDGSIDANTYLKQFKNDKSKIEDGKLIAKISHVDHYHDPYRNGTRIQFVSYLTDYQVEEKSGTNEFDLGFKFPGEISDAAKGKGIEVPWQQAISSSNSIIMILSIPSVIAIGMGYYLSKKKGKAFGC